MALLFSSLHQFTDNNTGAPVASGTLTLYDTGTTTLKSVYTDAELSVAASNPITLDSAGRLSSNLYCADGERFTAVLKTSAGAVVESSDDVWGVLEDLLDSNFLSSATDAVTRTLQSRLDERLSLADFGVVGDGVTNDTDEIVNAIDAAIELGVPLYVPYARYVFDGYRIPWGSTQKSLTIIGDPGNRPVFIRNQAAADAGGYSIFFASTRFESVTGLALATDITTNDRTIEFTDATGLAAGMIVHISSDRLWYNGNRSTKYCGEIHKITEVSGNTVTLEDFTRDVYSQSGDTLTIRAFTPNKCHIENIIFETASPASNITNTGIALQQCDRPIIRNCDFSGFHQSCIQDNLCWKPIYEDITVNQPSDLRTDGGGYSIGFNGTVGATVSKLNSNGNRRGVDLDTISGTEEAAVARDNLIVDSYVTGGGVWPGASTTSGVGPHGPAENTIVRNCVFSSLDIPILARGRKMSVQGCEFYGETTACISLHENAAGLEVRECIYDSYNYPNKLADIADKGAGCEYFVRFGLTSPTADTTPYYDLPVTIEGCTARGMSTAFIFFAQNDELIENLTVRNNTVEFEKDSGVGYLFYGNESGINLAKSYLEIPTSRAEFGAGVTVWHPNLTIGQRVNDIDNWVQISEHSYVMTIPDDNYFRIQQFDEGFDDNCTVSLQAGGGFEGIFRIAQANATLTDFGGTGANVSGYATVLDGTTGADGDLTLHLNTSGDLYIENRTGSERVVRVSLVG